MQSKLTAAGIARRCLERAAAALGSSSGNIAVTFGLMIFAILGLAGLGLDYGRLRSAEERLQSAADAAVIAAKATGETDLAQLKATAEAYFAQNAAKLYKLEIGTIAVTNDEQKLRLTVPAKLKTTLAGVVGVEEFEFSVVSEASASTEDLELALVLDNTGSMADHMDELKTGARDLVNTIFDNAANGSKVKIAVVPYVGAVNIGNGAEQMSWMDTMGNAIHHGGTLEWMYFGYEPGCVYTPGGGGPIDPGTGIQGALPSAWPGFAESIRTVIGITPANAANAADVPSPFNFSPDCWIASPSKLNYFDLFAQIPNTEWKGCVEARAEPYDVTDEPPSTANADTLFVPWFWPDEQDHTALAAEGTVWRTPNDYLPDRLDLRNTAAPKFTDGWSGWGINNVLKYNGTNGVISETGPDTSGPNKSCPDPLLPLTNVKDTILTKIDGLVHWNGSGTNVAEGLAWGWRVISPEVPFTEGDAYGKTKKVIVLMTDGLNNVDPVSPEFDRLSHMSAYGYLQQWGQNRIMPKTYAAFKDHTDERLEQICVNARTAGVTIYTVAFGITDSATLTLLENCATAPPYAFTASTAGDLVTAFRDIAGKLSELRLTK